MLIKWAKQKGSGNLKKRRKIRRLGYIVLNKKIYTFVFQTTLNKVKFPKSVFINQLTDSKVIFM